MFKRVFLVLVLAVSAWGVSAHDEGEPIHGDETEGIASEYDIVFAQVIKLGSELHFQIVVAGEAGALVPETTGAVAGAQVGSYVWPTSLDTSAVGFEAEQGILALAATVHPDFDDTPLWDENGDGDPANDGDLWHSHWVVLVEDSACEAGLKVRDIPADETPAVPETWPELPILIDSPNYDLTLHQNEIVVTVPQSDIDGIDEFNFDGVAAGLEVNANLHDPFLCVTGVEDIVSGDLSLPGITGR